MAEPMSVDNAAPPAASPAAAAVPEAAAPAPPSAPVAPPAASPQPQQQPAAAASPAAKPGTNGPATFSNPQGAKAAEKAAMNLQAKLDVAAMPIKQYLEATVVPTLMLGMQQLARERPDDPIEYLASYLLQHNPKKKTPPAAS